MAETETETKAEVVVVGGGQAGLAMGFYLQRAGLRPGRDVVILDADDRPGGAWRHMWEGLRLFSPASFSSLPGWMMPPWDDAALGFPPREHVIDYLTRYEERYDLAVRRPHRVTSVTRSRSGERLQVHGAGFEISAGVVVSTTGTWSQPFWPVYPGAREFAGRQLHAVHYRRPEDFQDRRVVVVGGGNSAAQILAEISTVARTLWVTARPPRFLPDDMDGRDLFAAATARIAALREGRQHAGVGGLGDIVMVPSVREARSRGALVAQPMFDRLTPDGVVWDDGSTFDADAVVWCTGFRPAVRHLRSVQVRDEEGRVAVDGPSGTRAIGEDRLYLVGYGDWTGPASATLSGVGRSARATSEEIVARLGREAVR
ncbi:MAG: ArsO family NAD(P)H-dependent flavin-containing monooxygenase [Intrasporangiaceae bacterium]|nr:ArsO family NAD(P)H-dependent flavin-containing monooxygenase [Intrasporangiaceae bacterium]